uniref:uncharacterized protein LOC100184499 isoform X2 n=1 Tax=Ciona intestinalis TaxID=7719 RepID=UPI00089DC160|nr:uncharacterized protein LOC100184499 isoform X2 [Ciona intestinalis]|eukprot:XP_018671731.1 uncharacterized protein LOC100184499 isoform X2 [Ciona intestinalis]
MEDTIFEEETCRPLEMTPERGSPSCGTGEEENRERKTKLNRNKSMGSFRKFFKRHSRSFSEDHKNRERTTTFSASSAKSDVTNASSSDDVFQFTSTADDVGEQNSATMTSEQMTSEPRHNTLPRRRNSKLGGDGENPKSGARLWQKARERMFTLGSFSFSRQLSPSGSTPENGCFASAKVDSVYQVLKEGLVLRSTTVSPGCSLNRNQSIDSTTSYPGSENGKPSAGNSPIMNNKFKKPQLGEICQTSADERVTSPATRSNCSGDCVSPISDQRPDKRRQNDRNETGEYTMVALHKFDAQQKDDLSLKPGDVITVTDDRDEAWLIGSRDGKSGFFPTNFAMIINAGESICSCVRSSYIMDINNKEVQLKKNQIVVVVNDAQVPDHNFLYTRIPNVEGYVRKEDLKPL